MTPLEKAIDIIVKVADPDTIILFGSRARKNHHPESDYDLFVIKDGVEHRRKLTRKIYRALYGIGQAIDVIVDTSQHYQENKSNPYMIYQQVATDGKILYQKAS